MNALSRTRDAIAEFERDFASVEGVLKATVVGQDELVRELLVAVFAGGHVLLEGVPGLGKTQLAKALAKTLGCELARVQCTPDLMPADITGSELLGATDGSGQSELRFRPGPIFAPLVLVDEINRATARTQSALLEAMQEGQVTQGGRAYALPSPFWVIATQNPIEQEGTYALPEAQLDRFFFKCVASYPDVEDLVRIIDASLDAEPSSSVPCVLTRGCVVDLMATVRHVVVARSVVEDAARLILATQPDSPRGSGVARARLRLGASPRALQTLLRAARVLALASGRAHVDHADIAAIALPALRHRVLLSLGSEIEGIAVDDVLLEIVEGWA
jgi:MoxR-like ATPase